MIASLRGLIEGRTGNAVIIDVNGVGYLVQASARTLEALGELGSDVRLVIVTQVREDAITLLGFADTEERDVFTMLTSVQGVGARIALGILSVMAPNDVLSAIVAGDRPALTRADGVGPKLAGRIISELGDKALAAAPALSSRVNVDGSLVVTGRTGSPGEEEARLALIGLGFGKAEVEQLLAAVRATADAPAGASAITSACLRLAGSRVG